MKKATKRLTSTYFMERYRHFLADKGLVHLKTDSNFLFTYTEEMLKANNLPAEVCTRNLYAEEGDETLEARSFQTYYEGMWRDRGIDIKYLRFRLPQDGKLEEPDVEIPLDEYRSYNRSKRSGKETAK
jgi:tRNA (guanine-N7-)-methyltransferase